MSSFAEAQRVGVSLPSRGPCRSGLTGMQEEQGFEAGGNAMPLYVRLVNLTDKGLRDSRTRSRARKPSET